MYKLLTDKGQMFALLLGLVCIAVFFGTVLSGLSGAGYSVSDDLNQIMKNNPTADFSFFDTGIVLVTALIAIALVAAVVFGLIQLISSPKSSLKGILGVIAIVAVFFITYNMASADMSGPIVDTIRKFNISENISKMIGGGITTTAILGGIAFLLLVVFEVFNLFK